MTFSLLLKRRLVSVIPTSATTTDDLGNEVTVDGAPVETWATRQQLSAEEEIQDRDLQARTFVYFFGPDVVISGRDRIEDDGKTYEVIGEPEEVFGRYRLHHIEVRAEIIEG